MRSSAESSRLAVIALGSNLGDSITIIGRAVQQLEKIAAHSFRRSSVWRSTPVDCPPGSPEFLNAVVALVTDPAETPESLLGKLQELERQFGRPPSRPLNAPRFLDLDLIVFGNERRDGPELTLPHPRAQVRRFVLAPLAEIAPDLVLPGQTETVSDLLERLPKGEVVERLRPGSDARN
jgi:2-amino-4-hydroxy-6-hydroxymethyldihydropteridine diphosphokinase